MRLNNRHIRLISLALVLLLGACASSTQESRDKAQSYYMHGNYALAYKELFPLAKHGDSDAQYTISYMFYYGQGVAKDEELARTWMRKSADAGNPKAKYALQLMLDNGYRRYPSAPVGRSYYPSYPARPEYVPGRGEANKNPEVSWIRQQNPDQYTLTLSANKQELSELLQKQNTTTTPVVSYRFKRNGLVLNSLAYGTYASTTMAELTKNKLDERLRKSLTLAQWKSIQDVMLP